MRTDPVSPRKLTWQILWYGALSLFGGNLIFIALEIGPAMPLPVRFGVNIALWIVGVAYFLAHRTADKTQLDVQWRRKSKSLEK